MAELQRSDGRRVYSRQDLEDAILAEREACAEAAWAALNKMDSTLDWDWIKDAIRNRNNAVT